MNAFVLGEMAQLLEQSITLVTSKWTFAGMDAFVLGESA